MSSIDLTLPFKIKLPEKESKELDQFYDFVFGELGGTWAGRVGHYPWGEEHQISRNQDGYIYVYENNGIPHLTADCSLGFWNSPVREVHLIDVLPLEDSIV
tara:strand:+ start:99080 stop:99382 length:303 start_codon:yes stop_codon:yes gene_type:complete